MPPKNDTTEVLIIGAGLVGLSASLFLSQHGIRSVIIEKHSGTSIHPRARSVNARTMELFRRLGITDKVIEAGASIAPSGGMLQGTTLKDVMEARKRKPGGNKMSFGNVLSGTSPVEGAFVTQDSLEPILVEEARKRGVDIKFHLECLGVEQDGDSVTAKLKERDTEKISALHARFLIAADGAKSPIREQLKVPTSGRGSLGHLLNILFFADLKRLVHDREFSLCRIEHPEVIGTFTSVNNDDKWVFHMHYDSAKGEKAEDYTFDRCKRLLKTALGMPDVEIKIKSILPWEPSVVVATKLRFDNILLAGDAAHQMPPYAGQGANSGIADAHNLAWKMAAIIKGIASPALLDTYEAERLPVGRNAAEISAIGVDDKGLLPMDKGWTWFYSTARKVPIIAGYGYDYDSSSISHESTWPLGGLTWKPWTVSSLMFAIDGRPGRRVPHVWVQKDGKRMSTLDFCGSGLVIFTGAGGLDWSKAAREIATTEAIEIATYRVGPKGDLIAPPGVFEHAAGITSQGAIMIRPDDFVCWRSRRGCSKPKAQLEEAVARALCIILDPGLEAGPSTLSEQVSL